MRWFFILLCLVTAPLCGRQSTETVRSIHQLKESIRAQRLAIELRVDEASRWSDSLEEALESLERSRDRVGGLSEEICALAAKQKSEYSAERAERIGALIEALEEIGAQSEQTYQKAQAIVQDVDGVIAELTSLQSDLARLSLVIDRAAPGERSRCIDEAADFLRKQKREAAHLSEELEVPKEQVEESRETLFHYKQHIDEFIERAVACQ